MREARKIARTLPHHGSPPQRCRCACEQRRPRRYAAQPRSQPRLASLDVLDRHALVVGVGESGVTGSVVDGRDAEGREPRDIGPAVLGAGFAADRRDEPLRERIVEAGPRAVRQVGEGHVVAAEQFAHVRLGLGSGLVGREPVVDGDDALVGDHVAGDPAADADGVEALAVDEPLDLDLAGLIAGEQLSGSARPRGSRCRRPTSAPSANAGPWCAPRRGGCRCSRPRSRRRSARRGSRSRRPAGRGACGRSARGR